MKSIFGAIVLSFGVKVALDMLGPFFLAHMMLSLDELRTSFAMIFDSVSVYQKAKR
jgi:hypothetical protein